MWHILNCFGVIERYFEVHLVKLYLGPHGISVPRAVSSKTSFMMLSLLCAQQNFPERLACIQLKKSLREYRSRRNLGQHDYLMFSHVGERKKVVTNLSQWHFGRWQNELYSYTLLSELFANSKNAARDQMSSNVKN